MLLHAHMAQAEHLLVAGRKVRGHVVAWDGRRRKKKATKARKGMGEEGKSSDLVLNSHPSCHYNHPRLTLLAVYRALTLTMCFRGIHT